MSHKEEQSHITTVRSVSAYRTSIWTPVDEDDLNDNRQKYIDAGWQSYLWTKGYGGGDKHFLSKLPRDEFKELIYVKMDYPNFCLFYDINE